MSIAKLSKGWERSRALGTTRICIYTWGEKNRVKIGHEMVKYGWDVKMVKIFLFLTCIVFCI